MKDGKHPNPNTIHPIAGYDKEIYVKPTITNPNIIVGDFTYIADSDFCTRVCKILVGYTCILRCGLQMKTLSFGIQWENAITQKPNFFIFG